MTVLNSITHAIPMTPQRDPNNFPRGEFQPYPRMMVQKSGKPFTGPNGSDPVIVQNEDEEDAFRAAHPGEVRDNIASAVDDRNELIKLREENARLRGEQSGAAPKSSQPQTSVSSLVKPATEDAEVEDTKPAAQAAARRTPGKRLD